MDRPTPLIRSVATPAYRQVVVDANDGNRYFADLSAFAAVVSFPPDFESWSKVSIDSYGLGLVWACRFEVHADQVVGLAHKVERSHAAA